MLLKKEIIKEIFNLSEDNIYFIWVRRHLVVIGNEFADLNASCVRRSRDSDPFCDNSLYKDDFRVSAVALIKSKIKQMWTSFDCNKYQLIHPGIDYAESWNLNRRNVIIYRKIYSAVLIVLSLSNKGRVKICMAAACIANAPNS